MGPILFTIYINGLFDISDGTSLSLLLHADDASYLVRSLGFIYAIAHSKLALELMFMLFSSNRLTMNASKTKFIILSTQKNHLITAPSKLQTKRLNIVRVGTFTLLGVHIDEKLSFNHYVSQVCNKLSRSTAILYK